jgi:hypothetical protein
MKNNKLLTTAAISFALLGVLVLCSAGVAETPKPAAAANADGAQIITGLEVYPPNINLETALDAQSLVAKFTQPDGVTRDVTAQCQFTFANPALARLDGHQIKPARRTLRSPTRANP